MSEKEPTVILVYNTDSTDLNYGGWDVILRQNDGSYKCVAETQEFPSIRVMGEPA